LFSYFHVLVLTAVKVYVVIFWVLASCSSLEDRYQKIEKASAPKTIVTISTTTRCQNPANHNLKRSLLVVFCECETRLLSLREEQMLKMSETKYFGEYSDFG